MQYDLNSKLFKFCAELDSLYTPSSEDQYAGEFLYSLGSEEVEMIFIRCENPNIPVYIPFTSHDIPIIIQEHLID